jgi:long-chain fatty acid transport protein
MRYIFVLVLGLAAFPGNRADAFGPGYTRINAVAESAETAYTNPAGMTRFDEKTTSAGATFIKSFKEFNVDESRSTVGGGDPGDSDPVLIPSFYHIRPLDENWRLGFAANVAAGFGADNGSSWAGRYYNNEFSLAFVSLTPSLAYPVNDKLSLGLAVPVTVSNSVTTSLINSPVPNAPDGELEVESTDVSASLSISSLYEFSKATRIALIYRAESDYDTDPDVEIKRYSLPANVIDTIEDAIDSLEYNSNLPQSASFGLFHQLDNGWQITVDAVWVDFSEFGITDISIVGQDVVAPDSNFNDIYALSVGAQLPVKGDTSWRFGMVYMTSAVDDEDRTFSFALDRMFGIGVGMHKKLASGNHYDLNFNLIDTGESPIDTGSDPVRGRVAGESDNHYAITVDFSFHWR